jgi:hypothetical protein
LILLAALARGTCGAQKADYAVRRSSSLIKILPVLVVAAIGTFMLAVCLTASKSLAEASSTDNYLSKNWIKANVPDGFALAAVGDLIITTPAYQKIKRNSPELIKLLNGADVTFGNFEGSVLNLPKFEGYPAALSGGSWLLSAPSVLPI